MGAIRGKAPADTPALKPYWGKPAVRNFRGDDGNVGIIRSPVRAILLPDRAVEVPQYLGFRVRVRTPESLSPGRNPQALTGLADDRNSRRR